MLRSCVERTAGCVRVHEERPPGAGKRSSKMPLLMRSVAVGTGAAFLNATACKHAVITRVYVPAFDSAHGLRCMPHKFRPADSTQGDDPQQFPCKDDACDQALCAYVPVCDGCSCHNGSVPAARSATPCTVSMSVFAGRWCPAPAYPPVGPGTDPPHCEKQAKSDVTPRTPHSRAGHTSGDGPRCWQLWT